jgi:hypothetical protein
LKIGTPAHLNVIQSGPIWDGDLLAAEQLLNELLLDFAGGGPVDV